LKHEYRNVRFRATEPRSGFPPSFGILTACNPDGRRVEDWRNTQATKALSLELVARSLEHFSVTGGSPDFSHAEPGFGIGLGSPEEAVDMGKQWCQEAVFWVEGDIVTLWPCSGGEGIEVGRWSEISKLS